MINKVILIGNVGKDPEQKTESLVVCSLATNESYKDKNGEWQTKAEWHNIQLWNQTGDNAMKILTKGDTVYIEGKISTSSYDDKDGNKRYSTNIVCLKFKRLTKRDQAQDQPQESKFPPVKKAQESEDYFPFS